MNAPRTDDGRNVASDLGVLSGEAAPQKVSPGPHGPLVDVHVPHAPASAGARDTYYDLPILKPPVWIWTIPAYFHVGGVAGGAAMLGAAARLAGRDASDPLVRTCRWTAAVGAAVGAGLLTADLGRPERFLGMLRVLRPSSPMSVGAWLLTAFGGAASGAVLLEGRPLGEAAGVVAAVLGAPVTGYTGVLLADTAVPVWQHGRRMLPLLFMASAASSTAAFLDLLPSGRSPLTRRLGVLGKTAELTAAAAYEHEVGRQPRVGRALRRGRAGVVWRTSQALTAASLALTLLPGRSRARTLGAALLGTAAGLGLRHSLLLAGRQSARDPRATVEPQRARTQVANPP